MMITRMPAQAEYRRSRLALLTHAVAACATVWGAALRVGDLMFRERLSLDGLSLTQGGIRLNAATVLVGNGSSLYAFGSDDPIGKLNRCWSSGRWQHQGRKRT